MAAGVNPSDRPGRGSECSNRPGGLGPLGSHFADRSGSKSSPRILAIDPGSTESAWLLLVNGRPVQFGKVPNVELRDMLRWDLGHEPTVTPVEVLCPDVVVIESMAARGEKLWTQTIETLVWAGQFIEAARPLPVERLTREAVKRHLCPVNPDAPRKGAATDGDVWASLVERFGGGPDVAVGRKAAPGPLYGIHSDVRAALAVAIAWLDRARS